MLAHHYREALALAQAAGLDTSRLRAPAQAALAEASVRAVSLNAWPAAEELALAALAARRRGDPQRPHLLAAPRAPAYSPERRRRSSCTRPCRGFPRAATSRAAAEAEAVLSWMAGGRRHRGAGSRGSCRRARSRAGHRRRQGSRVAQPARVLSLAGREVEAVELGRERWQMAEEIETISVASHALNSIGMSRVYLGEARRPRRSEAKPRSHGRRSDMQSTRSARR